MAKCLPMIMKKKERSLVEEIKHAAGEYGGFCFGGQQADGVTVHKPLPAGTIFPNGATAAVLLTFDVEGNYSNSIGDQAVEIANYERICGQLRKNGVQATFNVVGKMAEEHGPRFVEWMLEAGCEVAGHGYVHDMNRRYPGDKLYAGHYGPTENLEQVKDSVAALNRIQPGCVHGIRLPYGHFNEYSYEAINIAGLIWTSNVGIDDFVVTGQGFGGAPFQMQLGNKIYPIVEIPLDSQTYDWSVWAADEEANTVFVNAVRSYCQLRKIAFERTPAGGVTIWRQRMTDTIASQSVFTLLCHPINLVIKSNKWDDPVEEFLFPVIDELGKLHREGKVWTCTCAQMTNFYWKTVGNVEESA